jgi:hypothetical protein
MTTLRQRGVSDRRRDGYLFTSSEGREQGQRLVEFLKWARHGEKMAKDLDYAQVRRL